jgi:Raf kinase inhibitor-like YbhB/YbcL family protein
MAFALTSTDFTDGGPIPTELTCDGADRPPTLAWSGAPEGTSEFALVFEDPDARGFVHWVVGGIPGDALGLTGSLPAGAREGRNDFNGTGYSGPCPPARHTYVMTLYALAGPLDLRGEVTADAVRRAAAAKTLATATLRGTYGPRRG